MRPAAIGVLAVVLASCGAKYKPQESVLTPYERAYRFPAYRPHDKLLYTGSQAATAAPVVPVLAFGAAFDLDFVLMPADDDEFDMIEFAKVDLPSGPQWIALETAPSGNQTLLANLDDLEGFMPEIGIERKETKMVVTDESTENTVSLKIEYDNSKGQHVVGELVGDPPDRSGRKRNGRTFDHSQNQLMAALDVAASESLFKADVTIDGKGLKLKKIAAVVPARFTLVQTQGGLSIGNFQEVPTDPATGGPDLSSIVINAPGAEPTARPAPDVLVKMAVAQNVGTLTQCWRDRLEEKDDLAGGQLTVTFAVDGGAVSGAAPAEGEQGIEDEPLVSCVTGAIDAWTFDSGVSADVTWPFTFVAGSDEDMTDPAVKPEASGDIQLREAAPAPAPTPSGPVEGAVAPGAKPAPAPGGGGAVPKDTPDEADADGGPGDPLPAGAGDEDLLDDGDAPEPEPEVRKLELSNFTTIHQLGDKKSVELQWLVTRQGDRVFAKQTTDLRTLTYTYRVVQDTYVELVTITVDQFGRATPVTAVTFNPPLPDLRWPFGGRWSSDFVIDVNGQQNLAHGTAEAFWTESGPKVQFTGDEPSWVADRPLLSTVGFGKDGTSHVETTRTAK
ncbi:MAG: hypothetical protein R3F59_36475 [Myxococcota bacterium]